MENSPNSDERRDRAIRGVLWASLATALAPMLMALVLVQPALDRLRTAYAAGVLDAELGSGRSPGDQLRAIMARGGFPGLARLVRPEAKDDGPAAGPGRSPTPLEPTPRAANELARAVSEALFAGRGSCRRYVRDAAGEQRCLAAVRLRPDRVPPLRLPELTRVGVPALNGASASAGGAFRVLAWSEDGAGVYVAEVGRASFTLEGALALDDFASLRPIEAAGMARRLAGGAELHHSVLSGRAEGTFARGPWRLRPELDLGAAYLALDEVRLDAGEAGLFLPETDDWIFSARPSLALEGEIAPAPGLTISPSLRAGATWLSQSEFSTAAMMLDAPATIAGIHAIAPLDELFADIEAGVGLSASDRFRLSLRYGGMFGDAYETHTGRLELNLQF